MEARATRSEADYRQALQEVSTVTDLNPLIDSLLVAGLDVLGSLVQAYEAKSFPVYLPDPIETTKFRIVKSGLSP